MDGFYKGTLRNMKSNWLGKTFFALQSSGINNYKENGKIVQKYPFKTYIEKNVLKLDYNLPQNPWWLRLIIDELVEVERDKFDGVMKIKFIPVARFRLEK